MLSRRAEYLLYGIAGLIFFWIGFHTANYCYWGPCQ